MSKEHQHEYNRIRFKRIKKRGSWKTLMWKECSCGAKKEEPDK